MKRVDWNGIIIPVIPMVKTTLAHAGVFLLMLVLAIGAVRFLDAPTDLIRAVPLLYFLYISIVLIVYGLRRRRKRGKEQQG